MPGTTTRSWCKHGWRGRSAGSSFTSSRPIVSASGLICGRLWGLMHKHVTHNRCHETFADFSEAVLTFLRDEVPREWHVYCDAVSDNFRVISPKDCRVVE